MPRRRPSPTYTVLVANRGSYWEIKVEDLPEGTTTAEHRSLVGARIGGLIKRRTGLSPGEYELQVRWETFPR